MLLEFLVAAGLLRLTHDVTWRALATAALLVGVRRLVVGYALRPARGARRRPAPQDSAIHLPAVDQPP